ncbi:metalloregulator ArsR/SmtB family transcription factor [Dehalobacter restrictus]|uniref:ArsR/SmtB family transcription factor n=1 Tax=Dehalobacter restrictus TaxID=55583 RepID=UPI00338DD287
MSDELRLNILFYLYQDGEKCVCSLTEYFATTQSALSYHLKILTDNGLLIKRQEAVWNLYSLNKEHFMFPMLKTIFKNQIKAQINTNRK